MVVGHRGTGGEVLSEEPGNSPEKKPALLMYTGKLSKHFKLERAGIESAHWIHNH